MQSRAQESYFDYSTDLNSRPSRRGSPERNMLMSLLERAILDYVGNSAKEIESSEEWLSRESDENQVLSFKWLCQALDLDPKFIRDTVKAMPKRGSSKVAPWYTNKIK